LYFYVPKEKWPEDIDIEKPVYFWSGNRSGKWNWTIQTYNNLKKIGCKCQLTNDIETEGIVIAHRGVIGNDYIPHRKQLLVCVLAERYPHDFCQNHILQNPVQEQKFGRIIRSKLDEFYLGTSHKYLKYWPQPEIIPRSDSRGDMFERVVFMGVENQIDPTLLSVAFRDWMEANGFSWDLVFDKSKWNDYSQVDAVISVRKFGGYRYDNKPASKLVNSWFAGVPALLGEESSFQYEGRQDEDYLEVKNIEDLKQKLLLLKKNVELRKMIIANGFERLQYYDVPAVSLEWKQYLEGSLKDAYIKWINLSKTQCFAYLSMKRILRFRKRVSKRVCSVLGRKFDRFV